MSYKLTFTEHEGYLHARVTGENSAETLEAYTTDIYKEVTRRGFSAVLIEEALSGPALTPVEAYRVISKVAYMSSPLVNKIAYIDVNLEHPESIHMLGQAVANDRGANVRVFREMEEAMKWLESH